MKKLNKICVVCECRPDKNVFYYLTQAEYVIVDNLYIVWSNLYGGKPNMEKILAFVKASPYYTGMFENVKIEEKTTTYKDKLDGIKADYILFDDINEI